MMHLSTVAKLLGTALTIQAGEFIIIGYGDSVDSKKTEDSL